MPHIDENTTKAVARALFDLNSTNPAAVAGGIATFSPPQSYHSLYQLELDIGWLQNGKCIRSNAMYATIVCPPGTFKISEAQAEKSCEAEQLPCQPDYDCVCRPCRPVPATETDVLLLPGNRTAQISGAAALDEAGFQLCSKLKVCVQVEQNVPVTVALRDNWVAARPALGLPPISRVQYKYYGSALGDQAPFVSVSADSGWTDVFPLSLPTPRKGFILLEVRPQITVVLTGDVPFLLCALRSARGEGSLSLLALC